MIFLSLNFEFSPKFLFFCISFSSADLLIPLRPFLSLSKSKILTITNPCFLNRIIKKIKVKLFFAVKIFCTNISVWKMKKGESEVWK